MFWKHFRTIEGYVIEKGNITITAIYIQSGIFNLYTILVAIPTTLFIGTILLTNNLSDIEEDREAGRKTLLL